MNTILQKRIEEAAIKYSCANPSEHENGMYDQSDLEWAYEAGATYALQHQWISVEEGLPEKNTFVLVRAENQVGTLFNVDYIDYKGDWYFLTNFNRKITHWMPIIEPKGGE